MKLKKFLRNRSYNEIMIGVCFLLYAVNFSIIGTVSLIEGYGKASLWIFVIAFAFLILTPFQAVDPMKIWCRDRDIWARIIGLILFVFLFRFWWYILITVIEMSVLIILFLRHKNRKVTFR